MEWAVAIVALLMVIIFPLSLSVLMIKKKKKEDDGDRNYKLPKGSSGWPFIGETLDFIASGYSSKPVTFMDKRKSMYGNVFKTHILGRPIIVSTDPEVNKVILQNQGHIFIPYYPKTVTELLGKSSILQMNGPLHRKLHAIIGGFLRSPQLKARITRSIEHTLKLSLSTWLHKSPVFVQQETKQMTFEVLVKVLMSVESNDPAMEFLKREYEEFIKGLICLPIKFPGTRMYKSLKAKERLLRVVKTIVEDRKVKTMDQKGITNDVVDILLGEIGETNEHLPLDFICGNIVEMMIPGEDSVPMIMTLAVKFLSDSSLALSRLQEENMDLKRRKRESGEDYLWTDYMSLSFTQNVINETLRMANIINAVWRKALKDVEIKGYIIPRDWCVLASFSSVHMDEEIYKNPYHFDPFRWDQKEGWSSNNSNIAFTPFGGGQRLCPGLELSRLEISIFLHHLVTTYRWVADDEDSIVNFPTVKMKKKLPIKVMPVCV